LTAPARGNEPILDPDDLREHPEEPPGGPPRVEVAPLGAGGRVALLTWTFLGSGLLPVAPGTWGSLAACLVQLGLIAAGAANAWTSVAIACLALAIGIPAASRAERYYGKKDPGPVVIDEVSGYFLTVALAPATVGTAIAGFVLFRAFDIAKPPPARQLERIPHGTGIMVDDLAAGVYAGLALAGLWWGTLERLPWGHSLLS